MKFYQRVTRRVLDPKSKAVVSWAEVVNPGEVLHFEHYGIPYAYTKPNGVIYRRSPSGDFYEALPHEVTAPRRLTRK